MIVVVGSGIAGVSAAAELAAKGKEVVVLEAGNYVGGRLCTSMVKLPSGESFAFDLGASWIHGSCEQHPITQLAPDSGLSTVETDDDNIVCYNTQGKQVSSQVEEKGGQYRKLMDELQKFEGEDKSIWQYFMEEEEELAQNPYFLHNVSNDIEFETSACIKDASAKMSIADQAFDGTEQLVVNGYNRLVTHLIQKHNLKVLLNSKLTSVAYDDQEEVTKLRLQNGQELLAQAVIFAVPLSVLQKGLISFQPPLPDDKTEALSKLGLGNTCKILIVSKTPLYQGKQHYVSVIPENPDERGLCAYFLNLKALANLNLLMTFGLGANADEAEYMPLANLKQLIGKRLQVLLERPVDLSEFEIYRTSWRANNNIGGTYTYPKVSCTFEDWAKVSEPVADCQWYFCGEHTTFRYRGTVHGARLTGIKAAEDLLKEGQSWAFIDQAWWDQNDD